MIDLHCHILPGVDDGARNLEESVAMLQAARRIGVDRIVATPHVRRAEANLERIQERFHELRYIADAFGIRLTLGYEVYANCLPDWTPEQITALRIEGTALLLLELPDGDLPPGWEYRIGDLRAMGLQPLIAHAERNAELRRHPEKLRTLVQLGCALQVDAESLSHRSRRQTIHWMCKNGLPFVFASDAHRPDFYAAFAHAARRFPSAVAGVAFLRHPAPRPSEPLSWHQNIVSNMAARAAATTFR